MILAAVFGLEVLRWEAGIAVAVPNAIREETFEGGFLCTTPSSFVTPFDHVEHGWDRGEACCKVPWVSSKSW